MQEIKERIKRCWPGEILWDCRLANFSTLRVGGPADALIQPGDKASMIRLIGRLHEERIPWHVIGRGSNIVVADRGVDGVVIVLGRAFSAIHELETSEGHCISVEAGCSLARLLHFCSVHSLSGLEFVTGIPGSVGGAIMMNAGAWGGEISQALLSVELLDNVGNIEKRSLHADDFCYRGWQRPHGKIVISGQFLLHHDQESAIRARCQRYARLRAAKQPKGVANAGSFFRNPPGDAAGRLIEQAGLKGLRVGDAEVSSVHANFLVNRGKANAEDLRKLMYLVQNQVENQFGVHLHPEVLFLGRWEEQQ
ncbi:MAG: UDP-N-acetylmuramate dehydrogenase [Desulfobulbaceae bacterium]|nr:UDP-N-acetylmuramate dehydrogenase [Desulfobulbaceae bacterium]